MLCTCSRTAIFSGIICFLANILTFQEVKAEGLPSRGTSRGRAVCTSCNSTAAGREAPTHRSSPRLHPLHPQGCPEKYFGDCFFSVILLLPLFPFSQHPAQLCWLRVCCLLLQKKQSREKPGASFSPSYASLLVFQITRSHMVLLKTLCACAKGKVLRAVFSICSAFAKLCEFWTSCLASVSFPFFLFIQPKTGLTGRNVHVLLTG